MEAKPHRDDPDKEDCVPEEDNQHRQLHQPEVQEPLLLGKQAILEMHTYSLYCGPLFTVPFGYV